MAKAHKIRFILIGTALLLALLFLLYHTWYLNRSFQRIEKDERGIPIIIEHLETIYSMSNIDNVRLKLTLTNDFNTPRWYIFTPILGDTLPSDGFFYSAQDTPYVESWP